MDKEIAGQPMWVWLVGAGVVIVGYLYFKSRSSAAPATSTSTPAASTSGGTSQTTQSKTVKRSIVDLHSHPRPRF